MRPILLDGERIELSGHRISGMKNWRSVRRLTKAGYLRAVWARGPLRGMEYHLTTAGVEAAARAAERFEWRGGAFPGGGIT